jgi:hypothetical protein
MFVFVYLAKEPEMTADTKGNTQIICRSHSAALVNYYGSWSW